MISFPDPFNGKWSIWTIIFLPDSWILLWSCNIHVCPLNADAQNSTDNLLRMFSKYNAEPTTFRHYSYSSIARMFSNHRIQYWGRACKLGLKWTDVCSRCALHRTAHIIYCGCFWSPSPKLPPSVQFWIWNIYWTVVIRLKSTNRSIMTCIVSSWSGICICEWFAMAIHVLSPNLQVRFLI